MTAITYIEIYKLLIEKSDLIYLGASGSAVVKMAKDKLIWFIYQKRICKELGAISEIQSTVKGITLIKL